MDLTSLESPHRRFDPLRGKWILVSPQRTKRPWLGEVAHPDTSPRVHYDPACYLCPGNTRAGGKQNPQYSSTFVFINDYAALVPDLPAASPGASGSLLFRAEPERGLCKVLCFHPDHSLTLAHMTVEEILPVVRAWREEWVEIGSRREISYVQIFENRGAMMGASNPHPHCQIWATEHIPDEPAAEVQNQLAYRANYGACLLCGVLDQESRMRERIVCENESFLAVVPFWAVWPFEILLLSRRHLNGFDQFAETESQQLADILRRITIRYDNLFQTSFPYTMGFHQRPTDGDEHPEFHFHAHFYPPLLRSATVRKYMVGFEMLGMPQRDITAESAAERLRALPERHYSEAASS